MLFHKNRSNDCQLKRSFNKLMRKHRLDSSDQPKRWSASTNSGDHHSETSTDDTSSSLGEFQAVSSELVTPCEIECMASLRQYSVEQGIGMSERRLFRFACYHRFNIEKAKEAVHENRDNAFLDLEMRPSLQDSFVAKSLFPLSGLTTKKHDSQVVYTNPSRGDHSSRDSMTKVLESLCYVMNDYSRTEQQCRDGIALITHLDGFEREHFDEHEWHQFMTALQGGLVPTRVTLVLLVNPPAWFQKDVWRKLKSSMPSQFRRNVHAIVSDKLGDYLMEDYWTRLPSELPRGYRDADEIIEDYVDLKAFEDRQKRHLVA